MDKEKDGESNEELVPVLKVFPAEWSYNGDK